jgi:endonuclease-3
MDKAVKIIKLVQKQIRSFTVPIVTEVSEKRDPFLVLISCILSLRTKDKTTQEASQRLFRVADNPKEMLKLSASRLEKIIYPVGFYRKKAKVILDIARRIIADFAGRVPNNLEALLGLKGVGRKTANLVLGKAFGIPAICVDTHVHRISNRLGWVKTKIPRATEEALAKIIPKRYWVELNTALVTFGQNICLPVSPFCSKCYIRKYCNRIGVKRWR